MPTTNPEKNREYVKKSNEKKKSQLGEEEYNKYFAENERTYRTNKKEKIGVEVYRKQQAEYMKEYRTKKKQEKGATSMIGDYIKASKARRDYINELSGQVPARRRGRPRKQQ
jgi:hypothetical protein